MKKILFLTGLVCVVCALLSCANKKNQDETCRCTEGTTVNAGDLVCIDEKRYKCIYDDDEKKYKLKETTETCDEEDVACEKE